MSEWWNFNLWHNSYKAAGRQDMYIISLRLKAMSVAYILWGFDRNVMTVIYINE